jgi:glycosyltransferase involved in cell wall biosynthesis
MVSVVSVVIPTYNRREALGEVLDRLLASDRRGLTKVEIVVVDDGSPTPAATIVGARRAPPGFTLTCVRQENAGPAAARNRGFTTCRGDIVIFIDDDILVSEQLIRQHVEAHQVNPGAVIFGECTPLNTAGYQDGRALEYLYRSPCHCQKFEGVSIIASGQLSVERKLFPDGVYASHLRTPGAEEFEFSARLAQQGIRAIKATHIEAIHDQSTGILDFCYQQYKHGMGCAEAVCKLKPALIIDELATIAAANGPVLACEPLITRWKKRAKAVMASPWARASLIWLCRLSGRLVPSDRLNVRLSWHVIGIFFFSGYREGLRRFGPSPR